MEQSNIYNQINFSQSTFNTANLPPSHGHALGDELGLLGRDQRRSSARRRPARRRSTTTTPTGAPTATAAATPAPRAGRRRRERLEPEPAPDPDLGPDRLLPDPRDLAGAAPGRGDEPGLRHRRGQPVTVTASTPAINSGTITDPADRRQDPDGLGHRRHVEHPDRLGVRLQADRLQRQAADLQVGGQRPAGRRRDRAGQQRRGAWADQFTYSIIAGAQGRRTASGAARA